MSSELQQYYCPRCRSTTMSFNADPPVCRTCAAQDDAEAPDAPLVAGKVIGYRAWLTQPGSPVLLPVFQTQSAWHPGVNHATCLPYQQHAAPRADCHCGIYAYHDLEDAIVQGACIGRLALRPVIGAVAAWGRIEVHHNGFRAEHAEIVALSDPVMPHAAIWAHSVAYNEEIARAYRVPLVARADLERVAAAHGRPVAEDLRPKRSPGFGYLPRPSLPGSFMPRSLVPVQAPRFGALNWVLTAANLTCVGGSIAVLNPASGVAAINLAVILWMVWLWRRRVAEWEADSGQTAPAPWTRLWNGLRRKGSA